MKHVVTPLMSTLTLYPFGFSKKKKKHTHTHFTFSFISVFLNPHEDTAYATVIVLKFTIPPSSA